MTESYPRDLVGYGAHPPHPRWPGGARVCVQAGSTSALNAEDYFRSRGIDYTPVVLPTEEAAG